MQQHHEGRIIRLRGVIALTGLSRSSIYAFVKANRFPKPIQLGLRCVGWLEKEVEAWIKTRVEQSRS